MEEKVTFKNSKGQNLVGIIDRPVDYGHYPCVILCYGFTSNMNDKRFRNLSERLVKLGYVVFRYDVTGTRESEGRFPEGDVPQQVSDLKKAISYMRKQNFIDTERIGVVGHSLGASVAMLVASDDERIKVLVSLSAGILFEDFIKAHFTKYFPDINTKGYFMYHRIHNDGIMKEYKITKEYLEKLSEVDVITAAKKITIPSLIVYGTEESESVTEESLKELIDSLATEQKKLEIIEGADHGYRNLAHENLVFDKVINFLRVHL